MGCHKWSRQGLGKARNHGCRPRGKRVPAEAGLGPYGPRGLHGGAQDSGLACGSCGPCVKRAQPKRLAFVRAVPSQRLANGCGPSVAEGCRPKSRNKAGEA